MRTQSGRLAVIIWGISYFYLTIVMWHYAAEPPNKRPVRIDTRARVCYAAKAFYLADDPERCRTACQCGRE